MEIEKPDAQTPWSEINHLLLPDERFKTLKGYLFAPKSISRLSALLYTIQALQIPLETVRVSIRAFKQIYFKEQDVVEVEAGCDLRTLQTVLFEHGVELKLDDSFISKESVGEAILRGTHIVPQSFLGAEIVRLDGSIVRLGLALHQLLWGGQALSGLLLKCRFRVNPIPAVRLHLTWRFHSREELWKQVHLLKSFGSSWEKIDCVIPGNPQEKGVVMAQMAGSQAEMEAFKKECPFFQTAILEDKSHSIRTFLMKEHYLFESVALHDAWSQLTDSRYLWIHSLTNRCWLVTKEPLHKTLDHCVWI